MPLKLKNFLLLNPDILLALGVVLILVVMIFPIHTSFMDMLLVLNLGVALLVLMVSMYIRKPLQFSVFPGFLLIITLFRLSLNVASTRLILGNANAGKVIYAFGDFVVKGNYVVGLIIFLILVIINFVVITKGAGRVAEVAARFTLDSMPGKQMSIDADLNAGLIEENEARRRRSEITQEADFYGAMDGASKFVRGDAIAGLVITFLNIIGGLVIGVAQHHMSVGEAVTTYTRLTVGDGLVSQIPALIISTAAGLVVTRTTSDSGLGRDVTRQILHNPRAILLSAGVLLALGLTPGLPFVPFFALGLVTGAVGLAVRSGQQSEVVEEVEEEVETPLNVEDYLRLDPLELEIGYGLIALVDEEKGGDLLGRITQLRKQCASEIGVIIPPIRIRDNIQLKANEYAIKIKGIDVAGGQLMSGRYLALNPGSVEREIEGKKVVEPAFGLPAVWISDSQRNEAEMAGYTVVESVAVLTTHLLEVLKANAHQILGRQEVQNLLDKMKKDEPALVDELVPNVLSLGKVEKVLQNLLRERVSIRNLSTLLETLADWAPVTKDTDILTEYSRQSISETVVQPYINASGNLSAMTLDPDLEQFLTNAVQDMRQTRNVEGLGQLILDPEILEKLYSTFAGEIEICVKSGLQAVAVTSPGLRYYLRKLMENVFPNLVVLSYAEIPNRIQIESIGKVGFNDAS